MGIAPGHAERVFDPFWQVDHSAGRVGGTGLGLAVTRQLAGLLGGGVTLESELGSGSVLSVRLPMTPPEPEAPLEDGSAEVSRREQRVRGRRGAPRRGSGQTLEDARPGEASRPDRS
jgi:hypothetical protein